MVAVVRKNKRRQSALRAAWRGAFVLRISLAAGSLVADLRLLAQAAKRSLEVRERLLHFVDLGTELVRVHPEAVPAAGALQCGVHLDLCDGLRELAAAIRAGQFDGLPVLQARGEQ